MPKNKNIDFFKKIKPYLIGNLRGVGVFSVLFFVVAFIMYKTNIEIAAFYYLIYLFIVLGGFVNGVYVYKKVRGRGFLTGVVANIPYSIIIFLIFCIVNSFNVSGNIFLVFLLTLSGGFLGGVTAANTKI